MKLRTTYRVRTELHPRANKHGRQTILIRVLSGDQKIRVSSGAEVPGKFWDMATGTVKSTYPTAPQLNMMLRNKINQIEQFIYDQQQKGVNPSLKNIKLFMVGGSESNLLVIGNYAQTLIDQLQGKFAPGTLTNYRIEIERLEGYHPGLRFDEVDHRWLKSYEAHLRTLGMKENSIHKVFKQLNKFFNAAIKDQVINSTPFTVYQRPKYVQGDRTYLASDEVERIEKLLQVPVDPRIRRAAVWFLFGCYSGLRFSDWKHFTPSMIRGSEIVIRAKKNGQLVVMPIHSRLASIIKQIEEIGPPEAEPSTNAILKDLAVMAGISKNLTTHVARHSFAVRCAELGISIETTAELMGINVKTCQIYYKVTGNKVKAEMAKWG